MLQLERSLSLAGIHVSQWYDALPRTLRCAAGPRAAVAQFTLSQFYAATRRCVVCDAPCEGRLCAPCAAAPRTSVVRYVFELCLNESVLFFSPSLLFNSFPHLLTGAGAGGSRGRAAGRARGAAGPHLRAVLRHAGSEWRGVCVA